MPLVDRLSLRQLLTGPYVLLVLVLTAVLGGLSFQAGRGAVDDLSGQLLVETVNRIAQAVDRHIAGSEAVLETAFPRGVTAPTSLAVGSSDLAALRTRLWLATSVHRDPNNYAYYGDRQGRFIGLWRHSDQEAELRLRTQGDGPRTLYRFMGIQGALQSPVVEPVVFEPRRRPWFESAYQTQTAIWTAVYIDFRTQELVATRARRVNAADGTFQGVAATDLSLQRVNTFLSRLALSRNGVAMVMEGDGQLIGVSRSSHLRRLPDGRTERVRAGDSPDPLIRATYQTLVQRAARFTLDGGREVQYGFARLRDDAGLDWLIAVAVPRSDFLGDVERSFHTTGWMGLGAAGCMVGLGFWVLSVLTRELRRLANAARHMGEGHLAPPLVSQRRDELGDLARSFADMQTRLLTDPLTGLYNRNAVQRQIEERIREQRRRGDPRPFTVLFIDVNRFKQINDRFGHDVGDAVLCELAQRLREATAPGDIAARYAGDEFVLMLGSVERRGEALALRLRLQHALSQPLAALAALVPPDEPQHGAAIGLALYPDDGQDADALLRQADADMYAHKRGHR
jgi:diguanylate cyclase (GGDEF)-like protein